MNYKILKKSKNYQRDKIITNLYLTGISMNKIGKRFDVSRQRVEQIISNRKKIKSPILAFVLERDNYQCQWNEVCDGTNDNIETHHIDLNSANNDPNNLITLCKYCHQHFHNSIKKHKICSKCGKTEYPIAANKNYGSICKECYKQIIKKNENNWAKRGEYEKCIKCGTTEKKHCGNGLCTTCYAKERYKDPEYKKLHKTAQYKWNANNKEKKRAIDLKAVTKYNKKNKDKISKKRIERYKNDPEYRQKMINYWRKYNERQKQKLCN